MTAPDAVLSLPDAERAVDLILAALDYDEEHLDRDGVIETCADDREQVRSDLEGLRDATTTFDRMQQRATVYAHDADHALRQARRCSDGIRRMARRYRVEL